MYHPRDTLCSASFPSPASFLKDSGSSHFRGSGVCSGCNSVWMTNKAVIFALSIQCLSSTVMAMMPSMNTSIGASVSVISTVKGSAVEICLADCCSSSCEIRDRWGELRSSLYQDSSWSISLHRSIASSLTVVYSSGVGVVPKGKFRQRKASSLTIAMHVDAVVAFVCIQR